MTLTISTREEMGRVCVRWCRCQPDIRVISIKFSHKSLQTRTISVLRDLFKYICWVHTHAHCTLPFNTFFCFFKSSASFSFLIKGPETSSFFVGGVSWSSRGDYKILYATFLANRQENRMQKSKYLARLMSPLTIHQRVGDMKTSRGRKEPQTEEKRNWKGQK